MVISPHQPPEQTGSCLVQRPLEEEFQVHESCRRHYKELIVISTPGHIHTGLISIRGATQILPQCAVTSGVLLHVIQVLIDTLSIY